MIIYIYLFTHTYTKQHAHTHTHVRAWDFSAWVLIKKRDSVPFYQKDTTKLPKIVIHVHLDLCRSCFGTKKERKGASESLLRANVAYPEIRIRPDSQRLSHVLTRHVHGRYPTHS